MRLILVTGPRSRVASRSARLKFLELPGLQFWNDSAQARVCRGLEV
jgi:hypothetical protein